MVKFFMRSDYWGAKQAKHKELLNHFLYREAAKAKEYVGKFEAYAQRLQTKGVQAKLGLAGTEYQEQVNRLLGRYGLGPSVRAERTLAEWTAAQYEDGKEPAIDPAILDESRQVCQRIPIDKEEKQSKTLSSQALGGKRMTLYETVRTSELSAYERRPLRLANEGFEALTAGSATTASAMSFVTYHIIANEDVCRRLRQELVAAMPDARKISDIGTLQEMPYLASIRDNFFSTSFS